MGLKPVIFKPEKGDTVIYSTAACRYYFAFPNKYLSLSGGYGDAPDLLDLDSEGFVIIRTWHVFADYNWPVYQNRIFVHLGIGYTQEKFPSGKERKKVIFFLAFKGLF